MLEIPTGLWWIDRAIASDVESLIMSGTVDPLCVVYFAEKEV